MPPSATAPALAEELLARCLAWLPLPSFPAAAAVSPAWRRQAATAFEHWLSWRRGPARVQAVDLQLPMDAAPSGQVLRSCGHLARLPDGRFVVLLGAPAVQAVRSVIVERTPSPGSAARAGAAPVELKELPLRRWPYKCISGGMGGLVGYAEGSMAFFPAQGPSNGQRSAPNSVLAIATDAYQNILQSGDQVFLLRAGGLWNPAHVLADVVDLHDGGFLRLDIAPFRDSLAALLGADPLREQAVSATEHHFIVHCSTSSGAKVAGAVRLPRAAGGATSAASAAWAAAPVSYARRWPPSDPIAQLPESNELAAGDALVLYGIWTAEGLPLCILHSATGRSEASRLWPPASGPARWSFAASGVAALAISLEGGLAFGCGAAPRGLLPPPVVVWDLASGLAVAECSGPRSGPPPDLELDAQPRGPPSLGPGGLRFRVGDLVECFGREGWTQGRIVRLGYREDSWPADVVTPYQIQCHDGAFVFAPVDSPELVRLPSRQSELYENGFQAQLTMCPERRQVLCGFFHRLKPVGKVYLLEFGG